MTSISRFIYTVAVLLGLPLAALAQALDIRTIARTNDVLQTRTRDSFAWYQGEKVAYTLRVMSGTNSVYIPPNSLPVWFATDATLTNYFVWITGSVVNASSGRVSFSLPQSLSALPVAVYESAVVLYDGSPTSTPPRLVGDRTQARVLWSPTYTGIYVGPITSTNAIVLDASTLVLAPFWTQNANAILTTLGIDTNTINTLAANYAATSNLVSRLDTNAVRRSGDAMTAALSVPILQDVALISGAGMYVGGVGTISDVEDEIIIDGTLRKLIGPLSVDGNLPVTGTVSAAEVWVGPSVRITRGGIYFDALPILDLDSAQFDGSAAELDNHPPSYYRNAANITNWPAEVTNRASLVALSNAVAAASASAAGAGAAATNFGLAIGAGATNFGLAIGRGATQLVADASAQGTNFAMLIGRGATQLVADASAQGTNFALLIGRGATQLVAGAAAQGTNFALQIGAGATALVAQAAAQGTNFALAIGAGSTSLVAASSAQGTNFALAIGRGATQLVAGASGAASNLSFAIGAGATQLVASAAAAGTNFALSIGRGATQLVADATGDVSNKFVKTTDTRGSTNSGLIVANGGLRMGIGENYGAGNASTRMEFIVSQGAGVKTTNTLISTDYSSVRDLFFLPPDWSGTWDQYRIWRRDNDGAGSFLDADLIDGQDLSWIRNGANITNAPAAWTNQPSLAAASNTANTAFGWGDWKLGGTISNTVRVLNRFVIANDPASATTIGPNDSSFRLDFIRRLIGTGNYATSSINAASGGWLNRWDGDTSYKIYDVGTLVDPLVASGNQYAQIDTVHALTQIVAADTNVDVEKVANGDFDYDGAWVYTNARYSNGTVILPITNMVAASATPVGNPWVPEIGQMYRVRADATLGGGGANYLPYVSLGGVTSQFATVIGNPKTVYIIPKTAQPLRFFYPSGFGGASNSLDNVSVRRMSGSSFYVSPTELLVRNADRNMLRVDADGMRMGDASFHAEPSGDIWHDPTNTASLGVLTASYIGNTNGVGVLYSNQAPSLAAFADVTGRLTTVEQSLGSATGNVWTSIASLTNAVGAAHTNLVALNSNRTNDLANRIGADAALSGSVASVQAQLIATSNTLAAAVVAESDTRASQYAATTSSLATVALQITATSNTLYSLIAGETSARIGTGAALSSGVAAVAADLAALTTGAVAALDANNQATSNALASADASELAARIGADAALSNGVLTAASDLSTATGLLFTAIGGESTNRVDADAAISNLITTINSAVLSLGNIISNSVNAARLGGALPNAYFLLSDFQSEMTNRIRMVQGITSVTSAGGYGWMQFVPKGGGTNELWVYNDHALGTNVAGWAVFNSP